MKLDKVPTRMPRFSSDILVLSLVIKNPVVLNALSDSTLDGLIVRSALYNFSKVADF